MEGTYAQSGNARKDAQSAMTPSTCAPDAELQLMEPRSALAHRKLQPATLYNIDAWDRELRKHNLAHHFLKILEGFCRGFIINFPSIMHVQSPANKDSVTTYIDELHKTITKELGKGCYIGPLSLNSITKLIGPFQSSPLSIIPKPDRPGKYRLVQNFSFPHSTNPRTPNPSINSYTNAHDFPTTWGTFAIIYLLLSCLPPGSELATRDVAEAYRTIPLHPSQWPANVVRISETHGCIDTCLAFGASPSLGVYRHVADTGSEIMRHHGIGPLDKWVDDHVFARIRHKFIAAYNELRKQWQSEITSPEPQRRGARILFSGRTRDDDVTEEFNEDCSQLIRDLTRSSPRSAHDALFSYSFEDLDTLSESLSIPWEKTKDQPFSYSTTYIGFLWDLRDYCVSLSPSKTTKYLKAIHAWHKRPAHTLQDVKELYGKLLHACAALLRGRAYLTGLEAMLKTNAAKPLMPHRADKRVANDNDWWTDQLQSRNVQRPISPPNQPVDLLAFSDASSKIGIGIKIDISWAEAIAFELLVYAIDSILAEDRSRSVIAFGDNTGVVEGWRNGRHRNPQVNEVFKRIHLFIAESPRIDQIHTRYIPSGNNPADPLSRGIYSHPHLFLPPVPVPIQTQPFIVDAAAPPNPTELRLRREGVYPSPAAKILDRAQITLEAEERREAAATEDCAGSYSGSTLSNFTAGLHAWHLLHGLPWNINPEELWAILEGASHLAPASSKRALREPFHMNTLELFHSLMDLNDPRDAAIFACLTIVFYCVARLGEFTVPAIKQFDPSKHITRVHVTHLHDLSGLPVTKFRIPWTKMSPTGEDAQCVPLNGAITDPIQALEHHLHLNPADKSTHLFAWKHHISGLRPLSKTEVTKRIISLITAHNLPNIRGHSLRIGGTLHYLLWGILFDVVKTIGRWAGDSFTVYLCQHAMILAPYLNETPALLEHFTRYTMPPVR
ncbi:hypothetical protein M404DRAFT_30938 [Pisolithus tinctorius Marx 270]|uniref:Tyr recombinase domain-containing protein n=1 Tax=Pisolithus tinctorius Marx 270 TaxID=870435 RepID=A0A0C3NU60_PISTI|nr:hypothetical protein M404DRAFT_30938 [Pisolithus tinctorius Marx 270]